jgi:DUF2934 family protein
MDRGESRSKPKKSKTSKPGKPPVRGKPRERAAKAPGIVAINPDERHRMIALAAYYRAEQRGFVNGDPLQDWLAAEAEVAMTLQDLAVGKPVS